MRHAAMPMPPLFRLFAAAPIDAAIISSPFRYLSPRLFRLHADAFDCFDAAAAAAPCRLRLIFYKISAILHFDAAMLAF